MGESEAGRDWVLGRHLCSTEQGSQKVQLDTAQRGAGCGQLFCLTRLVFLLFLRGYIHSTTTSS
jgi:hypothetical protein